MMVKSNVCMLHLFEGSGHSQGAAEPMTHKALRYIQQPTHLLQDQGGEWHVSTSPRMPKTHALGISDHRQTLQVASGPT